MDRLSEYIKESLLDNMWNKPIIHKNIDDPKIMQSEVRAAINKRKKNKSKDPNYIVTEVIQALDDYGRKKN